MTGENIFGGNFWKNFDMKNIFKKFNLEKIIEYSWCFFVFLLPWQTRLFLRPGQLNGGYSEYLSISLYASDLVLIFILLVQGVREIQNNWQSAKEVKISRTWYVLAVLELIIFISIFGAQDKWLAVYHYILFLLGLGIFWLAQSGKFLTKNFYYSFFSAAFIQALLAIGQFIYQKTFAWKWLGLAAHDPATLGTAVVESIGTRYLRAYGAFDHPNILGAYLAVALLLFLIWQIQRAAEQQNMILWRRLIPHVFFITVFVALFFSFSRAAWLAFTIGVITLWGTAFAKKNFSAKKLMLRFSLITIILISIFGGRYFSLLTTRMSDDTRLEQKSINERLSSYQEAREIISNQPFFGVGIGNYALALRDELSPDAPAWSLQPVHNALLLIFAELGIFGALLVVIIILNFLWRLVKDPGNIYFLPILFSLIIFSLVDHWLISFHFGILFLWLGLGMVEAREG